MMLVRPTIEYASSTWNPHTNTDVNRLEQVQKNAARFVCNDYNSATSTSALVPLVGTLLSIGVCLTSQFFFISFIMAW